MTDASPARSSPSSAWSRPAITARLARAGAALARARPRGWDLALLALAALLAATTLFYPFGRDHGLYHYVGREWFRGEVPYRDTMDQKTPLIYLVYGLAQLVLGERFSSIRVVEFGWVLALGFVAARIARRAPPRGVAGAASVVLVVSYFGMLDFWHTAQCEVWAGGLALCSLALVEQRAPSRRPLFWAGALGGLAVAAKPTGVFLAFVVGLAALERCALVPDGDAAAARRPAWRRALDGGLLYAAGVLAPLALLALYFVATGAARDAYDVLVRCNAYYVEHEAAVTSRSQMFDSTWEWLKTSYPLSALQLGVPLLGTIAGVAMRSWSVTRRYGIALALCLAAIAGVAVQRKFFPYHWGAFLIVGALPAVHLFADLAARVDRAVLSTRRMGGATAALAALLVLVLWTSTGAAAQRYIRSMEVTRDYVLGRVDRFAFLDGVNPHPYDVRSQEIIGNWLREHTRPDEYIACRNFEPAMYLVARRRAPTRFFWTPWIAWGNRAYRREEWLAQDRAAMRRNPPRYLVAVARFTEGAESPNYYEPEYRRVFEQGAFVVMERVAR